MKKTLSVLTLAGLWAVALAQTNDAAKPKPARGPTVITADTWQMEWETRKLVYGGHVKVNDPQMQLTCEFLTALFRTNTPNLEVQTITAQTNVVIEAVDWEGATNFAWADKLVYSYSVMDGVTNQTLTLTGSPRLSKPPMGELKGDPIVVDLVKGTAFARDANTTIQPAGAKVISDEVLGQGKSSATNPPAPSSK